MGLGHSLLSILMGFKSLENLFIVLMFSSPLLKLGVSKKAIRCNDQNKRKGRIPHYICACEN